MNNSEDPRDALAALESTNDRLARRMRWPIWRHFAGGLLMTLLVAAVALPRDVAAVVFVTAMVLMLLIVRDDKRRHGMFVSGYQRGRTVWIIAAIIVLNLSALVIVLTQFEDPTDDPWFWATLSIVALGTSGLSWIWERVYRADVREGRL